MENICKFSFNKSSDLICSDFIYEAHPKSEKATRADAHLLGIPVSGDATLTLGDKSYPVGEGNVFLVPKGVPYSVWGEGFSYLYICFSGRRASELTERVGLSERACVSRPIDNPKKLVDFALDALGRATDDNLDLVTESVLLYILSELKPESKPQADLMSKITEITNQNFTKPQFSLSTLSDMLGYDGKYVSFIFKKKKGLCYTEYLRDLRIKHAIFLIEQGVVSVKNIALLSGYTDALYFSKVFKQLVGKSPVSYIREYYKEEQE